MARDAATRAKYVTELQTGSIRRGMGAARTPPVASVGAWVARGPRTSGSRSTRFSTGQARHVGGATCLIVLFGVHDAGLHAA